MTQREEVKACRDAFEYWFSNEGTAPMAVEKTDDIYHLMQTQNSWVAWQAAWQTRPSLEHPDFDWLIFKGDTKTLDKYTNNLKWTKFIKGGEDKNGHHLIFLVYDKVTVGAIKCKHSTTYIGALNYLKGQVKAPLEHIEGLTEALECNGGILTYALFTEKFKTTPSLTILKAAKLYADNMEKGL